MANPNLSQDSENSLPITGVSPLMAKLRALQNLSRLKSSVSTTIPTASPQSQSSNPEITPQEPDEEEIDWESLFAASTKKEEPLSTSISLPSATLPIVTESPAPDVDIDNPFSIDNLSFLPPTFDEDTTQKEIQQQISQSLTSISSPEISDSSDFFAPPFEVLQSTTPNLLPNTSPIPTLIDQIKLNPELPIIIPDSNNLDIIENTGSYPLTLTEDPTNPNPITQMLKKLQGQFGAQISDAMRRTRANILKTTKRFNNKAGDANSLEDSLFNI